MRHYLDHAATSPMRGAACAAYVDALETVGNASSVHGSGRAAGAALESAREEVAHLIGAHPTEVVFTSGATESNNAAVLGAISAAGPHAPLAWSAVEHHAVLEPCVALVEAGHPGVALPVDSLGRVAVEPSAVLVDKHRPALVAVMSANNETGAIQPVAAVAALAHGVGAMVHVDAAQTIGHVPWSFSDSGATTAAAAAHKWGGPLGVGLLLVRRVDGDVPADLAPLNPLLRGGGHERGWRAGTVNVPGAVASAVALREACSEMADQAARLRGLCERLVSAALGITGVTLTGPPLGPERLPGIVSLLATGAPAEAMLFVLDSARIDASNGAACNAGVVQPSHVIEAMGFSRADASSTLRFSLGWSTTKADVDAAIAALPGAVRMARASAR